jgi:hypothetical protein
MIHNDRAERKVNKEKMDDGKEELKGQLGFLTSRIDAHQEKTKARLDACLEKMEANPGEMQSEDAGGA